MDTDDISKLVEFANSLVSEKTRQHLETVEKDILRQTLKGTKLSAIEFPSYENSYVQRESDFFRGRRAESEPTCANE